MGIESLRAPATLAIVALLASGCSGLDEAEEQASSSTGLGQALIAPSTQPAVRVVELGGGARVTFAKAPRKGSELTVRTASPPPTPPGRVSLASPVKLTLRGASMPGGATLEFKLPAELAKRPELARKTGIATWNEKRREWTPKRANIDLARGVISVATTHFSWWQPWTWDWTGIKAAISQSVGELLGKRAGPAVCSRGQTVPSWVAQVVGVDNHDAIAVRACAEGEDDVLAVELVNNRPYGQVLNYGSAIKWGWHEPGDSQVDQIRNSLVDAFLDEGQLYLPPRGRASVGVYQLAKGQRAVFHIGTSGATLVGDVASVIVPEGIAAVGKRMGSLVLGECGAFVSQVFPVSELSAPDKSLEHAIAAADCLRAAFLQVVAEGVVDSWKVQEAAQVLDVLRKAHIAGRTLDIGWPILDLLVDSNIDPGVAEIGHGFSVRAASEYAETAPSSSPQPPPSSSPTSQPSSPPSSPPPPSVRGFTVGDAYLGGTWARLDPNDGTWYSKSNKPSNAKYWFPDGLGVGVDCARAAAAYQVHWADGTVTTWAWWAHVTDNTWVPMAALKETTNDGSQGLVTC